MRRLLLCAALLTGCVDTPPPEDVVTTPAFTRFPRKFKALQAVDVAQGQETRTLLASLARDGDDYRLVFLHPALQSPVLELTRDDGERHARWLVEGVELPFDPLQILDDVTALYDAAEVPETAPGVRMLTNTRAIYTLKGFETHGNCVFPREIELRFTQPDAPRLAITLKELEC